MLQCIVPVLQPSVDRRERGFSYFFDSDMTSVRRCSRFVRMPSIMILILLGLLHPLNNSWLDSGSAQAL